MAEYTVAERAVEWADAFSWASSNGGIGRRPAPALSDVLQTY
jgi:hypothetical protein